MNTTVLADRYQTAVQCTFADLPSLADSFVQQLSLHTGLREHLVRDAVLELVGIPSYTCLSRLFAVMARVFLPLSIRYDDTVADEDLAPGEQEVESLAHAALAAFAQGGLVAVGSLPDPIPLTHQRRAPLGDEAQTALCEAALVLRQLLLDGFVQCQGQAVSQTVVTHALDLADILSRSHDESVPQLAAWVLASRHASYLDVDELEELWEHDSGDGPHDWTLTERGTDARVDERAVELASTDGGVPLLAHIGQRARSLSPFALQQRMDEHLPSVADLLMHAPGHARVRIEAVSEGPHTYQLPVPVGQAYVPHLQDLAGLLRAGPSIPVCVEVVSLERAQAMGCPQLAGWYELDWADAY